MEHDSSVAKSKYCVKQVSEERETGEYSAAHDVSPVGDNTVNGTASDSEGTRRSSESSVESITSAVGLSWNTRRITARKHEEGGKK